MKGLLILGVGLIALIDAAFSLYRGGTEVSAGLALAYAVFASVFCGGVLLALRHPQRQAPSPLVQGDIENWAVNFAISGGISAAFCVALILQRADMAAAARPVDLILVSLVVLLTLLVPIRMAGRGLMALLQRAPAKEVVAEIEEQVRAPLADLPMLVPAEAGRLALAAGFGQIAAQVIKTGMIAEATCIGKPFTIIPMVVTQVQDVIASGQVRPTDQLIDVQQTARPGTITAFLEPLYRGGLEGVPPGGSCIANAYTGYHDEIESGDLSVSRWLFLHMVGAVGVVHAAILRVQALLLPVQTLVLTGH